MGKPIVWVTAEDADPADREDIANEIAKVLPEHEVIITTDDLELIDAEKMLDELERMVD